MITFGSLRNATCLTLLAVCSSLVAQDSVKTVILSPRVGQEIDSTERAYFRIFSHIIGFERATMFQRSDSSYFVRVTFQPVYGTMRDTIIDFPEIQVFMTAEKINHFEGIIDGSYRLGMDPARPTYADGKTTSGKNAGLQNHGTNIGSGLYADWLPLVPDSVDELLIDDPIGIWMGVGLSSYAPDYCGLSVAYRAVEGKYRAQGILVGHREPSFGSSTVLWLNFKFRLSGEFLILLDAGTQLDGEVGFKAAAASLQYNLRMFSQGAVHPYVAAGIGHYRISATQQYGSSIGQGITLDALLIDAASFGYSFSVGIEGGNRFIWTVFASYLQVPVAHLRTSLGTDANIDMSSVLLGAKISIPW